MDVNITGSNHGVCAMDHPGPQLIEQSSERIPPLTDTLNV